MATNEALELNQWMMEELADQKISLLVKYVAQDEEIPSGMVEMVLTALEDLGNLALAQGFLKRHMTGLSMDHKRLLLTTLISAGL